MSIYKTHIGVDIGSVSMKMAVLTDMNVDLSLIGFHRIETQLHAFWVSPYIRHQGTPQECFQNEYTRLISCIPGGEICVRLTGRGGKSISKRSGLPYIQEFQAIAEGVGQFYPEVSTIFEMGGETAKFLRIQTGGGRTRIIDYEKNGDCAAGTGLFFDQQAGRLKYRVEDVGDIIQKAERSASIAGRCSVFAKSDMIHAQQRGYTPEEILRGLCEAVVRNFKGNVTKGKQIEAQIAFIGGLSANSGVVNAMRRQFQFSEDQLFVPENQFWLSSMGAVLAGLKNQSTPGHTSSVRLNGLKVNDYPSERPLSLRKVMLLRNEAVSFQWKPGETTDAYLGIDIGSVSTNLALISPNGDLIHGIYCMTEGRPVEVVKRSLLEMAAAVEGKVCIRGAGTTGSGRELIGLLVGADIIKDEITAHKTGAAYISRKYLNKPVDTIFEIGGQDSKFISMKDGVVVDFALNDACAAGTGSFLEEQAVQIGVSIKNEFAELALKSERPLKLGERCTVFMEKELIPYLRQGIPKKDIVAGLAISVVQNYLNRVVKKRPIGNLIFFQGGTAYNDAVAAAFSTVLNKTIIVPPHNGIMGAIGAALLARQNSGRSKFRGWDLSHIHWKLREFTCKACSNECTIQEFNIEGEKSYWGDKCSGRYRKQTKTKNKPAIPDLFAFRAEKLASAGSETGTANGKTVGFPQVLQFFDRLPFWKTYFETLGFRVILSESTHQDTVHKGIEATVAEPCFPLQVTHGHLLDLIEKDLPLIFLPNLVNEKAPPDTVASYICPWAQTSPLVACHSPLLEKLHQRLYMPNVQFRLSEPILERMLCRQIQSIETISRRRHRKAFQYAAGAQKRFREDIQNEGRRVLNDILEKKLNGIVLVGRPYNLYDTGLNLNIPGKLRTTYGMNVIPMDCLPFHHVHIDEFHDHMFWNYGRHILQAVRYIREYSNLQVIYISNFKCGPDSYIRHYIDEALGRPSLFLQLDGHSNDAGVMTRIEAFLESKEMI